MALSPEPFQLSIPETALADLKARLAMTRFPDQAPDGPWAYGTDLEYMRSLVGYWKDRFDWRAQEAALNAYPQFKVKLHGIDVHYLHVPGQGPSPMPLLLMHGWPGSVFEFIDIIPRLTDPARFGGDPADAFTVIVPSLPGFGLSFTPGQKRFNVAGIAACLSDLMTEVLGCQRYAAQGGDYGGVTSARLGHAHPRNLIGIHVNMLIVPPDRQPPPSPTEEERQYYDEQATWLREETGYQWIQGTKPQTLAYALNDSPVGLAGWIVEKFRAWSDCGGDVETRFSKDELLTNITLYWLTQTIGSSIRIYHEGAGIPPAEHARRVEVPCGFALFPRDLARAPRVWAERTANVVRWTELPRGGHFGPFEEPELYVEELRAFFRPYRDG
jgi:pimeloyl-ACP methyl ester carboxylesterase